MHYKMNLVAMAVEGIPRGIPSFSAVMLRKEIALRGLGTTATVGCGRLY
jgi:hypothetical protein